MTDPNSGEMKFLAGETKQCIVDRLDSETEDDVNDLKKIRASAEEELQRLQPQVAQLMDLVARIDGMLPREPVPTSTRDQYER